MKTMILHFKSLAISLVVSCLLIITSCEEYNKRTQENIKKHKSNSSDKEQIATKGNDTLVLRTDTLTIIAVGDIMLGTNFPDSTFLPTHNGKNLLKDVHSILRSGDVTFGNIEGTFLNKGGNVKQCQDSTKCFAFRMPEEYANRLKEAGFNMVSIANNHVNDFGKIGVGKTMESLKKSGISYAGQELYCPTAIREINGIKYGLIAFAPNKGSVHLNNIAGGRRLVSQLKQKSDIVIVSFHGGGEGEDYQHVKRKEEKYFGENRGNVYNFSHQMIDAGADIVIGHGPHVTRGVELYKNKFIAYSLGNFCTYSRISLKNEKGIAPILKIQINQNGDFIGSEVISTYQQKYVGTKIDYNHKAYQKIKELTQADFPATNLYFKDNFIYCNK